MVLLNSVSRKQKMVILNIGADKVISFNIQSMQVNSYDSAGRMSLLKIEKEMQVIKEKQLLHCKSISMDLGGFGLPGTIKSEIVYAKISIAWSGKDIMIELGEEQMMQKVN